MFEFFSSFPNRRGERGVKSSSLSSTSSQSASLPLYSPITAGPTYEPSSPSSSTDSFPLAEFSPTSSDFLTTAQRHATATPSLSSSCLPNRPSLSRFLADFTLGFADGLTVPFALTAGLSSLGQTDTVIYAGMAEICAGSISMGIGGYLSAKGEAAAATAASATSRRVVEAAEEVNTDDEKGFQVVDRYLAPLDLPPELLDLVKEHISQRGDVAATLTSRMVSQVEDDEDDEEVPLSPVMSGLSVALGYLIGGILPLFPYLIVSRVGDGLLWSFIVCIIALFTFGFTKDFVLHMDCERDEAWVKESSNFKSKGWSWMDIRRSSWEGAQMVMLGSIAALAAVLCVRLFEGMGHTAPQP